MLKSVAFKNVYNANGQKATNLLGKVVCPASLIVSKTCRNGSPAKNKISTFLTQHRPGPFVPVSVFVGDVWLRHRRRVQRRQRRPVSSEALGTAQQSGLRGHLPPRRQRQHGQTDRAGERRTHPQ